MSGPCVAIDELARVAALPEGDPERRHLDTCDRCQARLAMLCRFESPGDPPAAAGVERAHPHLVATIERLSRGEVPAHSERRARPPAGRILRVRHLVPALGWVVAAGLLVVAGIVLLRPQGSHGLMRGESGVSPGMRSGFASHPATAVDGRMSLSWDPMPGADRYQVVFFDGALREIGRLAPTTATGIAVSPDSLPGPPARGSVIGWEVEALARGDRIARTATRSLRIP